VSGLAGTYLLPFYGEFQMYNASSVRVLAMTVPSVQSSVVTLTINASYVTFITNRSPGAILAVSITSFEALTRNGVLNVTVANIGSIKADYTVWSLLLTKRISTDKLTRPSHTCSSR